MVKMMKTPTFLQVLAAFTVFMAAGAALAFELKSDDRQVSTHKPVNISSSQLMFDRPRRLTLFTGNVKAVHDKIVLQADKLDALEENREATADGHVQVVDLSQGITMTCGNLEYQDLMNLMTAHDHPLLTTLDEEGHPITVRGRQMEVDSDKKTVVINQNVQILHKEGRAEAQKATFLSKEDKFILEDEPKVYTDNGLLSGRRIVSEMGGDRGVMVEGMADAIFNPNGKPVTTLPERKSGALPGGPAGPNSSQPVTNTNGLGNNAPTSPVNNPAAPSRPGGY
jgi:lipopolysaccharide export system protein LptA